MRSTISTLCIAYLVTLSGCFLSLVPFYEQSQVIQDDRLVGTYDELQFMNKPRREREAVWAIERYDNQNDHAYKMYLREGDSTIELQATLFRLDKDDQTLFLDLVPIRDSAMKLNPGGPDGVTSLMHEILFQARHTVWKVEFADDHVKFIFPSGKGTTQAISQAPELKTKIAGQQKHVAPEAIGMVDAASSPTSISFTDSAEAQKYLKRFAKDDVVFDMYFKLYRKKAK